jgi:hypothetical protein
MLHKLDNIPITITLEQALKRLKIQEEEDIALISDLFEKAKKIAKPKVLYREVFVEEIIGNNVRINGVNFESNVVAMNLQNIHRVFAYVCTSGTEVDEWSNDEKDYVVFLWLDTIKEMFLFDANMHLRNYLKEALQSEKLFSVNPGSGDVENWPIAQQVPLFEMIGDVKGEIGVRLSDSFLMTPIKSTSGLLYRSDTEFVNCALCQRKNCVGRRAEFDEALYAATFK